MKRKKVYPKYSINNVTLSIYIINKHCIINYMINSSFVNNSKNKSNTKLLTTDIDTSMQIFSHVMFVFITHRIYVVGMNIVRLSVRSSKDIIIPTFFPNFLPDFESFTHLHLQFSLRLSPIEYITSGVLAS